MGEESGNPSSEPSFRRALRTVASGLRRARSGATAVEYGLIAAIIATALIAGLVPLGSAINATFHTASNALDNGSD
ncbi:MAG: Flp family type IVb pilin [Pararhizobium sp.]